MMHVVIPAILPFEGTHPILGLRKLGQMIACQIPTGYLRVLETTIRVLLAVWPILVQPAELQAAALSGTITVPPNRGIRASLTIHDLSTPRTAGHKAFDRQFASKGDGTFSITGVPPGKYRICVDAPNENALDPCVWSATQPVWTVTDTSNIANVNIQVAVGTQIKVHVNDPQNTLPQTKGGVHGDPLSMTVVTGRGRHHSLRLLAASPGSSDHYLVVPFGEPVLLNTQSSSLALSDEKGKRLEGDSQQVPMRVPVGGSAPPVTVNVAKR